MKTFFHKSPEATVTILVFLFLLFFYLIATCIYGSGNGSILCQWDCKFYQTIMASGYSTDNAAFFPLFPWIWKLTAFSVKLVSLLNLLFFAGGLFFILKTMDKVDPYLIVLSISLSHFFYFMVPYTESLCFLGMSMFLYYNKKGKLLLAVIALSIITLTRPVFLILMGTFIAHILWDLITKRGFNVKYLSYILVVICFLMLYFLHLQSETSDFFAYFKARLAWQDADQSYRFPLKLSNWYIGFFEVFALIIGCWGMFVLVITLLTSKQFKTPNDFDVHAYVACFICAVLLVQNGILSSLNRFILCSPVFVYILGQKNEILSNRNYRNIFLGLVLAVLLCCWKEYPEHLLFVAILVFLNFYAYYSYTVKTSRIAIFVAVPINIVLQVVLFHHYLNNIWVA